MRMSAMIKGLNVEFKRESVMVMQKMTAFVGIKYNDITEMGNVEGDLKEQGFALKVTKHSAEDHSVGQTLAIHSLENDSFICGYDVWIDFNDDYKIKSKKVYSADQKGEYLTDFNQGMVN